MAKEYSKKFYRSKQWQETRSAYLSSVHGLCERCRDKGLIIAAKVVHHKQYLRPGNMSDPSITLDWRNLEALCQDCHAWEHHGRFGPTVEGLKFDAMGNLIQKENR